MYAEDMDCEYYEVSAHAGARPSHSVWQGDVPVDDVVDALKKPLKIIGDKSDEKKRPSVKYIGRNGTVSVNPTDGNLIQCNPTEEKVRKSLEERMLKK